MMALLQKLIFQYQNTHSPTVRIVVLDDHLEQDQLSELKRNAYISDYSYKVLDDDDYWECTLTQKAISIVAKKKESDQSTSTVKSIKKFLCFACALIGGLLLLTAIIAFIVGWSDPVNYGDFAYRTCYKCDGIGSYFKSGGIVSCDLCDGFGFIIYQESGENIMSGVALWLGIIGAGSLVMAYGLLEKK